MNRIIGKLNLESTSGSNPVQVKLARVDQRVLEPDTVFSVGSYPG